MVKKNTTSNTKTEKSSNNPLYPWYGTVASLDGLEQGDFVFSCPILEPEFDSNKNEVTATYAEYNVVILSQSCDLVNNKLQNVLVCPFWELINMEAEYSWFKSKKNKEKLRRGTQPNYHLLNACDIPKFQFSHIIVDFRDVFSVPIEYMKQYARSEKKRLRLLPPYKEHLAQAFARFFMRDGLPIDIRPFD
ncbi:MAG: hypothetical protein EU530_03410 [Promethearchaeota archaeon]|nr:MAG: hypothetical protein EU530_03410 [Candidatus Lokiarchaeota archaeon]